MKKWMLAGLFSMLLTVSAFAADVNGLWNFSGNNQTLIFFQEGSTIKVMCTYLDSGKVITWYGEGTISGDRLRYTLHHANTDDKWDYEHIFTVSSDGKTMSGTYGRVGRVQGNWTLKKIGPKN